MRILLLDKLLDIFKYKKKKYNFEGGPLSSKEWLILFDVYTYAKW